ncbi:hypothetical protein FB451DRAFT_299281 [Mycena latifolia]|nr:hypothetical protein FB451DRAFT_299281 [Mycena latifolia]
MDPPHPELEFTMNHSNISLSAGTFFPNAQHFVISGGSFTNFTTHVPSPVSSGSGDVQLIPFGEVDVRREISLDVESGMATRRTQHQTVRRLYSARVEGRISDMIAVIYEGIEAEKDWQQEIKRYTGIRHPNFLQLYCAVKSFGLHGLVFYDDLIPIANVYMLCRDSPLSAGYLKVFLGMEFLCASKYFHCISGTWLNPEECTLWIRPSTGRLCIDFWPSGTRISPFYFDILLGPPPLIPFCQLGPDQDFIIMNSFQLRQYHELVLRYLSIAGRSSIESHGSVQLGSIISCPTGQYFKDAPVIAHMSDCALEDFGWHCYPSLEAKLSKLTLARNSWTRFELSEVTNSSAGTVRFIRRIQYGSRSPSWGDLLAGRKVKYHQLANWWFAQANYIFNCLGITSGLEHYLLVDSVDYHIQFRHEKDYQLHEGYLFLCPIADLRTGGRMPRLCNPECWAYWSLDPSGVDRLSDIEAEALGFPTLTVRMEVGTWSWDNNTYAGLHKFHRGKGFDPDTQDVARHLGFPLYQLVDKTAKECGHRESMEPEASESNHFIADGSFDTCGSQQISRTMEKSSSDAYSITSSIRLAQRLETWLDDDSLVVFIEILESNSEAREAYCAIEREAVRMKWVRRKLAMIPVDRVIV